MKKIIRITSLIMAVILMSFTFAACGSEDTVEAVEKETTEVADNASEGVAAETAKYSVTLYADEVPAFVADNIVRGMKISDASNKVDFGLVTEVLNEDSVCYASEGGKLILTTKSGYRSLMITATVDATETVDGWNIADVLYGIGHKGTFHVGNTEAELTVRSFEAVK